MTTPITRWCMGDANWRGILKVTQKPSEYISITLSPRPTNSNSILRKEFAVWRVIYCKPELHDTCWSLILIKNSFLTSIVWRFCKRSPVLSHFKPIVSAPPNPKSAHLCLVRPLAFSSDPSRLSQVEINYYNLFRAPKPLIRFCRWNCRQKGSVGVSPQAANLVIIKEADVIFVFTFKPPSASLWRHWYLLRHLHWGTSWYQDYTSGVLNIDQTLL